MVLFVIVWVGLEMNSHGEEEQQIAFEIYVVVAKRNVDEEDENCDCIEFLMQKLRNAGVIVEIEFLA